MEVSVVLEELSESAVAFVDAPSAGTATAYTVSVEGSVDSYSYVYCAVELAGTPVTPVVTTEESEDRILSTATKGWDE